jgi:hypothetical protein
VREAVLTMPPVLNQLQPTYVGPEGKPSWPQTACLIKAGTLLNIWLYLHHGRTRDYGVLGGGKLCVLDLRLDQKIDGASGACTHALMHWWRGSG